MDIQRTKPILVVFDLDGTLIDTESVSYDMWKLVCSDYGYEIEDELIFSFIGRNSNSIRKKCIQAMGEEFPFDEIYQLKKDKANAIYDESVALKEGALELLDTLEKLGIKRAVATSSSNERAKRLLDKTGILNKFELIITGDMVIHSKPNPEIFIKTINEMNVSPLDTYVIEDSRNGIVAAKRSGAISVLVPDLVKPDEEMKEKSDFIFNSLSELNDYFIKSFK